VGSSVPFRRVDSKVISRLSSLIKIYLCVFCCTATAKKSQAVITIPVIFVLHFRYGKEEPGRNFPVISVSFF
jgi:hypothetical protein